MMKSLMMFAALALVAVGLNYAGELPREAEASQKYQANLTWDGGATGVTQVAGVTGKNQTVQLEAVASVAMPNGNEYCYKTCATSTCVPDCTKDPVLNRPTVNYQTPDSGVSQSGFTLTISPPSRFSEPIQMATDLYIVVSSMDAGNPNVNLYLLTKNTP